VGGCARVHARGHGLLNISNHSDCMCLRVLGPVHDCEWGISGGFAI
jgi:hypothetical protein